MVREDVDDELGKRATPTAFRPSAQGCEARATLGKKAPRHQSQRGCGRAAQGRNPVGVGALFPSFPSSRLGTHLSPKLCFAGVRERLTRIAWHRASGEIHRLPPDLHGINAPKNLPGEGFKRPRPLLIKMDEAVKTKIDALFGGPGRSPRR